MTHTWAGDTQWVLTTPGGTKHNILCGQPNDPSADFSGSYVLIDPVAICSGGVPFDWFTDPIPSGTYTQDYGGWTSGSNGILNTPIEQIPISSGTWTLTVYDWVGGDTGNLTSFDLCFGTPTTPPPPPYPQTMTCVGTGPGGSYPNAGVDGTWPTIMPTGDLNLPLAVTVPAGSTKIVAVKLLGWNHTWATDTQFVLEDPAGGLHNIYQADDGSFCGGCGEDLSGDYEFVDAVAGAGGACFGGNDPLPICTTGGAIAPGRYLQNFGAWPNGSSGINNTLIESIPVANGTYKLHVYDWCLSFDNGSLLGWELCFNNVPITISDCQTSPTVSNGCSSVASFSGTPSASSASAFTLTFGSLNGQVNGVVFYGINGPTSVTWSPQSNLCVKAPTQRLNGIPGASGNTGGTVGGCNGQYSFNMNAIIQGSFPGLLGVPMASGQAVNVQGWQRDAASPKTTNLTDSMGFVVGP